MYSPNWKAKWIWKKGDPKQKNIYLYFRKEFVVDDKFEDAIMHITADTEYVVWINNKEVGRGPVFGDPRWQPYDTYEVGCVLKKGRNVISVLCYYYGEGTEDDSWRKHRSKKESGNIKRAIHDSRPGLLCQLEISEGEKKEYIVSDDSWKSVIAESWVSDTPKIDDITFAEIYDANLEIGNWKETGYDDSRWDDAILLAGLVPIQGPIASGDIELRESKFDCTQTKIFPWCILEPRSIPHIKKLEVSPKKIIKYGEVVEFNSYDNENIALRMALEDIRNPEYTEIINPGGLIGRGSAEIKPFDNNISYDDFNGVRSATVILDMERLINGRVYLDIEGPAGGIVDIGYCQRLENGKPEIYSSRISSADRYIMREGRQQWTSFGWRHFRYMQITFRNLSYPLKINEVKAVADEYPVIEVGKFECSDELLNWIWKAGVSTTKLCTHDRFMDAPNREKRQYTGDVTDLVLSTMVAFGDTAMIHRYFRTMMRGQTVYGFITACNPTEYERMSLLSLCGGMLMDVVWKYYEYYGNKKVLEEAYIPFKRHLEFLGNFRGSDGLIGEQPMMVWQDWADVDYIGKGKLLTKNAIYVREQQILAWICKEIGEDKSCNDYLMKAAKTKESLNKKFWDKKRGIFVDYTSINDEHCEHVSEQGNYMMMAFNLVDDSKAERMVRYLKDPGLDIGQMSPLWFIFLAEGLFRYGYSKYVMDVMRTRFGRVKREGFNTLPELWSIYGSRSARGWKPLCQGQ